MPIHAPFGGDFRGTNGENGNFLQFYLSRNAITQDWYPINHTV